MKKILYFGVFVLTLSQAYAIDLEQCSTVGSLYSYKSCVSDNFDKIDNKISVYLRSCSYKTNEEDLKECITYNLRQINYSTSGTYIQDCDFYGNDDELSYSFKSCVNRQFDEIEDHINEKEQANAAPPTVDHGRARAVSISNEAISFGTAMGAYFLYRSKVQ